MSDYLDKIIAKVSVEDLILLLDEKNMPMEKLYAAIEEKKSIHSPNTLNKVLGERLFKDYANPDSPYYPLIGAKNFETLLHKNFLDMIGITNSPQILVIEPGDFTKLGEITTILSTYQNEPSQAVVKSVFHYLGDESSTSLKKYVSHGYDDIKGWEKAIGRHDLQEIGLSLMGIVRFLVEDPYLSKSEKIVRFARDFVTGLKQNRFVTYPDSVLEEADKILGLTNVMDFIAVELRYDDLVKRMRTVNDSSDSAQFIQTYSAVSEFLRDPQTSMYVKDIEETKARAFRNGIANVAESFAKAIDGKKQLPQELKDLCDVIRDDDTLSFHFLKKFTAKVDSPAALPKVMKALNLG